MENKRRRSARGAAKGTQGRVIGLALTFRGPANVSYRLVFAHESTLSEVRSEGARACAVAALLVTRADSARAYLADTARGTPAVQEALGTPRWHRPEASSVGYRSRHQAHRRYSNI
jgi:hypothetical protein